MYIAMFAGVITILALIGMAIYYMVIATKKPLEDPADPQTKVTYEGEKRHGASAKHSTRKTG